MQNNLKDFRERPLIFIDLEMSGLDPTKHEILEVGALVINPKTFEIDKEYEVRVKPEHIETADKKALEINGYKTADWQEAKPLKQVLLELNELAPGGIIVGWNISFDRTFLEVAWRQNEIQPSFDYHTLDVQTLAWAKFLPEKKPQELKLSEACQYLGIERKDRHRAMADIKATYEVFKMLIKSE